MVLSMMRMSLLNPKAVIKNLKLTQKDQFPKILNVL